ncbi:hypothetical protein [Kitasatospora sp. LaBMicrA B282]|uniref:hypothetical protein n=1 Tax=Kitasatospora sp. LaBMicrA B282 TaxID=3420949 RepID=UPI003D0EEADE
MQARILAAGLCLAATLSLAACSSRHIPACSVDSLAKVEKQDVLWLPPGVNPTDCGQVDDGQGGAYLSFTGSRGDVDRFLTASGLPAASADHDDLQRDVARDRGWSIADVDEFTPGLVGASGDLTNIARGFELTVDERDPARAIVYYYSFLNG